MSEASHRKTEKEKERKEGERTGETKDEKELTQQEQGKRRRKCDQLKNDIAYRRPPRLAILLLSPILPLQIRIQKLPSMARGAGNRSLPSPVSKLGTRKTAAGECRMERGGNHRKMLFSSFPLPLFTPPRVSSIKLKLLLFPPLLLLLLSTFFAFLTSPPQN